MNPLRLVGPRTITALLLLAGLELWASQVEELGRWTVMEQNERLGWRMLPNQDAWSRELDVPEHINSSRYRDREWGPPPASKDETVYRVAIVGNSISYGMGVAIEDSFGRVLEDALQAELSRRNDPRRALVMNFSVQGYVGEQMFRAYEDDVRPYRPDLLIVPHHPHDIVPMAPSADDPDYDFRTLIVRSASYELLNRYVIKRWIPPVRPSPEETREKARHSILEQEISSQPYAPDRRPYWDAYLGRLDEVRSAVVADGGRLLLLALPRWRKLINPKVLSTTTGIAPFAYQHADVLLVDPFHEFERLMAPIVAELQAKGIDLSGAIDLRPRLTAAGVELSTSDQDLFLEYDLGHYSARGHLVIGHKLAEALAAAGLP